MEIIGKIEVKEFLKCGDLEDGEVFTFLDDNKPLILCSDDYERYIVENGGEFDGNIS